MSNRKQLKGNPLNAKPAMFLATDYDKESEAWTAQSPTVAVSIFRNPFYYQLQFPT